MASFADEEGYTFVKGIFAEAEAVLEAASAAYRGAYRGSAEAHEAAYRVSRGSAEARELAALRCIACDAACASARDAERKARSDLEDRYEEVGAKVRLIEERWLDAWYNPRFAICKRRLLRLLEEMSI